MVTHPHLHPQRLLHRIQTAKSAYARDSLARDRARNARLARQISKYKGRHSPTLPGGGGGDGELREMRSTGPATGLYSTLTARRQRSTLSNAGRLGVGFSAHSLESPEPHMRSSTGLGTSTRMQERGQPGLAPRSSSSIPGFRGDLHGGPAAAAQAGRR